MNRGLLQKALREIALTTLILGAFLAVAEALLTYVLATQQARFAQQIAEMPFVQVFIKGLLGVSGSEAFGPRMLPALAFAHPVILALTWAHAIIIATRVPAGEIERGTIDVLLGLPISRTELFLTETFACAGAGVVMMLFLAMGHWLGEAFLDPSMRLPWGRTAIVIVNLFAVYLFVGSAAMLLSAASDRRGRAISIAFLIVLSSFLVNYLAEVWAPAQRVAFLSILRYHRPLRVLQGDGGGVWPVRDLTILGVGSLVTWIAAGVVLVRRDITTT